MQIQKFQRSSPRILGGGGVVIGAGRICERVAHAGVNVNFVVLAQSPERCFKCPDRLDVDAGIFSTEQPQNRCANGAKQLLVVGYLPVIDDARIQLLREQPRSIQRPATSETPSNDSNSRRTPP